MPPPKHNEDHDALILVIQASQMHENRIVKLQDDVQRLREDLLILRTQRAANQWLWPILIGGGITAAVQFGIRFLFPH